MNLLAVGIDVLVTLYFWWRNSKGTREFSTDALRTVYVTTVMVVIMILWSALTILTYPDKQRLPPPPTPVNLSFSDDAVGWMPQILPQAFHPQPGDQPR